MEGYIYGGEIQMKEQSNKETTHGGDIHTEGHTYGGDMQKEG